MSEKNALKINNENKNPNFYILSSWNYGSYSPTNPYYKTHLNFYSSKLSKTNPNISTSKSTIHNTQSHTKIKSTQISKSKRIVTNELLENYIFQKNMKKHASLGTFSAKNINSIINPKKIYEHKDKNNKNKIRKIKTDISEYKYKLNFSEWLNIKNKQIEYFRSIIKKSQEEDKKIDEENKKLKLNIIKSKNKNIKNGAIKKILKIFSKKK